MASAYKVPFAIQARDYFSHVSLTADFDQLLLARKAINKINMIDQLREINIPTLVMVSGEFGKFFVGINRKIADAIPDARFVVLHEAMDPSNLVNPTRFNQEVFNFLDATQ